jgi:acyl-CoA synthetase (AMP-forming)/AMP-acid ligase II
MATPWPRRVTLWPQPGDDHNVVKTLLDLRQARRPAACSMSTGNSLVHAILTRCDERPERVCLIFVGSDGQRSEVTGGALAGKIAAYASSLRCHGVETHDVVLLALDQDVELVALFSRRCRSARCLVCFRPSRRRSTSEPTAGVWPVSPAISRLTN